MYFVHRDVWRASIVRNGFSSPARAGPASRRVYNNRRGLALVATHFDVFTHRAGWNKFFKRASRTQQQRRTHRSVIGYPSRSPNAVTVSSIILLLLRLPSSWPTNGGPDDCKRQESNHPTRGACLRTRRSERGKSLLHNSRSRVSLHSPAIYSIITRRSG